jgi:peptidoglycan biosynthesis protein MviN/MurJ (putative lipid II flippase)
MKRIKLYNLLNIAQLGLGVSYQFLIARVFGANFKTDVYFVSLTAISLLSAVTLLLSELFQQHYADLHHADPTRAERFYNAVLTQSLIAGFATWLLALVMRPILIRVLAIGFDPSAISLFNSFFAIHATTLIWTRATSLSGEIINANMRFLPPYVANISSQIVSIAFMFLFSHTFGLNVLAFAAIASSLTTLSLQQLFIIRTLGIRFRPRLYHERVRALASGSASLRLGHQLWSLRDVVTMNVLSRLPPGSVSLFSYASKIVNVLFSITNSPALQVFQAEASRAVARGDIPGVARLRRAVTRENLLFFLVVCGITVALLPFALRLLGSAMPAATRHNIFFLFLTLLPAFAVLALEMPFVQVVIALKASSVVLRTAVLFAVVYPVILFTTLRLLGLYAIPLTMLLAQIVNFLVYVKYVNSRLLSDQCNVQLATP